MEISLPVAFLLLRSHRVGRDEAHAGAASGKNKGQAAASAGFAQGEVTEFSTNELLFDDDGIVDSTPRLLEARRHGAQGGGGWHHPNQRALWRLLQTRVPALYLPRSIVESQSATRPALDTSCRCPYPSDMEVNLGPELQARLTRLAAERGSDVGTLV
jgi:hypothetical protein